MDHPSLDGDISLFCSRLPDAVVTRVERLAVDPCKLVIAVCWVEIVASAVPTRVVRLARLVLVVLIAVAFALIAAFAALIWLLCVEIVPPWAATVVSRLPRSALIEPTSLCKLERFPLTVPT